MSLIGSRQALIANLCALVMVCAVIVEGAYIVHGCFGYYHPLDVWGFLTPAVVMFIIRNRIFSFCFLALYVALFIQMFYQASLIHSVPEACGVSPLGYMALFFGVSLICLVAYPFVALANFIISASKEKE